MTGLTILQQRVLTFIQRGVRREGKAPSYRAIARELGVDVRSAFQHIQALERKQILERVDGRIELLEGFCPPRGVPLLGRVAAGTPILAVENLEDHIDLGQQFRDDDVFLLRVQGDSMIDAGINDGDLVLARKQETVRDGEIAVVLIGEEATVKTVRFTKRGLRLEPANKRHKPIVPDLDEEVRVAGKVLMAMRVLGE